MADTPARQFVQIVKIVRWQNGVIQPTKEYKKTPAFAGIFYIF